MTKPGEYDHLNKSGTTTNCAAVIKVGQGAEVRVVDMKELATAVIKANRGVHRLFSALAEQLPDTDTVAMDPQSLAADLKALIEKRL